MIPKLKVIAFDGQPYVEGKTTESFKEFPTSVYNSLYSKWANCSDAKERKLTLLLWKSTAMLLSMWRVVDDTEVPYLKGYAEDWYFKRDTDVALKNGSEEAASCVVRRNLSKDLTDLLLSISDDDFVRMVDDFTKVVSKDFLNEKSTIMDLAIAPLSDEKKTALGND